MDAPIQEVVSVALRIQTEALQDLFTFFFSLSVPVNGGSSSELAETLCGGTASRSDAALHGASSRALQPQSVLLGSSICGNFGINRVTSPGLF